MQLRTIALIAAALGLIGAGAAAVPLSGLSLQQRLQGLPDSTLVSVGPKTVVLGKLRAAHRAREASTLQARDQGLSAASKFHAANPVISGLPHDTLSSPKPTLPPIKLSGLGKLVADVLEPPSLYAATPADMKAFCQNAWASACLYLPPGQSFVSASGGRIADVDPLLDQSQCSSERGSYSSNGCMFLYPASVLVRFTPGANYQVATSAQCDGSWWTYTVDPRGSISIGLTSEAISNLSLVGVWGYQGPPTGTAPWCVLHVKRR